MKIAVDANNESWTTIWGARITLMTVSVIRQLVLLRFYRWTISFKTFFVVVLLVSDVGDLQIMSFTTFVFLCI